MKFFLDYSLYVLKEILDEKQFKFQSIPNGVLTCYLCKWLEYEVLVFSLNRLGVAMFNSW